MRGEHEQSVNVCEDQSLLICCWLSYMILRRLSLLLISIFTCLYLDSGGFSIIPSWLMRNSSSLLKLSISSLSLNANDKSSLRSSSSISSSVANLGVPCLPMSSLYLINYPTAMNSWLPWLPMFDLIRFKARFIFFSSS